MKSISLYNTFMIIFESDRIWNESLVCDYFLSDRKKSDQVDQEDCFQIDGESKCRCGSQTVCRFYAEIRNVCSSDLSHRYKIWCGIFFSSGTDCISRCSHWSCSAGKSFQFCRGILILILKPFEVGDYIMVNSAGIEGTVKSIQIFIQE